MLPRYNYNISKPSNSLIIEESVAISCYTKEPPRAGAGAVAAGAGSAGRTINYSNFS